MIICKKKNYFYFLKLCLGKKTFFFLVTKIPKISLKDVCQTHPLNQNTLYQKHDKSNRVLKPFDIDLFCPRRLDLANCGRVDLIGLT
jgi:hypothetical protein